jgi:hypothetical protein
MEERALVSAIENLELEHSWENVLIAGLFSILVVTLLAQLIQRVPSGTQVPVSSTGYPAVAGNTGTVWIQMTPQGQANQVKIIAENSSGAFEEVLLGLTT